MRWLCSCTLALCVACSGDDGPDRESASDASVEGLWLFYIATDGKDDDDMITVQLEQVGEAVSGRSCSSTYTNQPDGTLTLDMVTCDGGYFWGTNRKGAFVLRASEEEGSAELIRFDLLVTGEGADMRLMGEGHGETCDDCAVSAKRTEVGAKVD